MTTTRSAFAVALFCVLVYAACAVGQTFAPPKPAGEAGAYAEAEEAASASRQALARLPPAERLNEIKDARLRRAVQATYLAVAELAENRDGSKTPSLNARFERAYAGVVREMSGREYKTCVDNCKACDGEPCRKTCRAAGKKSCGCRIIVFGCVVAECIF